LKYKKFSLYPYIVRDIAVFIPGAKGKADELRTLIQSIADELQEKILVNLYQFDEFEKKNRETGEVEKTSYAFRMIYQSYERTLTDTEVEEVMQKINAKITEQEGWEVR
jgi:phenylalanyl-tRNA synthetase beta chain